MMDSVTKNKIDVYAKNRGALQVWKSRRDMMLSMDLQLPEQDLQLDAQIAQDVIQDFMLWIDEEYGLYLSVEELDSPKRLGMEWSE